MRDYTSWNHTLRLTLLHGSQIKFRAQCSVVLGCLRSNIGLVGFMCASRCAICFDTSVALVGAPRCGHEFCSRCLVGWIRRVPSCPECRQPIRLDEVDGGSITAVDVASDIEMDLIQVRRLVPVDVLPLCCSNRIRCVNDNTFLDIGDRRMAWSPNGVDRSWMCMRCHFETGFGIEDCDVLDPPYCCIHGTAILVVDFPNTRMHWGCFVHNEVYASPEVVEHCLHRDFSPPVLKLPNIAANVIEIIDDDNDDDNNDVSEEIAALARIRDTPHVAEELAALERIMASEI